jgi:hypothetical protein
MKRSVIIEIDIIWSDGTYFITILFIQLICNTRMRNVKQQTNILA